MEWGTGLLLPMGEIKAAGEEPLPVYLYSLAAAHSILDIVAGLGGANSSRPNRTSWIRFRDALLVRRCSVAVS